MAKQAPSYDKEAMFRKIMPLSSPPETAAPVEEQPPVVQEEAVAVQPAVALRQETNGLVLINIMELAVDQKLPEAMERFHCCTCDRCKKDVAALALNELTQRYMVTSQDNLNACRALVNSAEVTGALVKAVLQVRKNPRH